VAGLRCAALLHEYGFEVTILEARERIGGRLHQVTLSSGHVVDAGPNWIHGTEGNPIMELAKDTNTSTHSVGLPLFLDV
jgi:phytoene dehydrogenase-like protein